MSHYPETPEDFTHVAEAFCKPQSNQYVVRTFGYCTECRSVAEYNFSGSPEGTSEECLKCGSYQNGPLGSRNRDLILTGDMVPISVKGEIDRLHSRAQQKTFFLELLDQKIVNQEEDIREARRLVKVQQRTQQALMALRANAEAQ
jgi:hypothetical protein